MEAAKLKKLVHPLNGALTDYLPLLESLQAVEYVLIGESTHGTEEFYQIRADITQRLIVEHGFNAVAIEGDWPDTYRVNRYVKGDPSIHSSIDALDGFKRFPTWLWRNTVTVKFIDWLHHYNTALKDAEKVGFYGLDLYSLNTSIEIIITYLKQVDNEAAQRAKQRYACFDHFKEELQSYGYATAFGTTQSCENAVIEQLIDLNKNAYLYLQHNGLAEDELFYIEQNARLVKNAEKYYRTMFSSKASSWNVRDMHMAETLDHLAKHLANTLTRPAKMVVWAHNSHIGDARATENSRQGQLNIGQLVKEKYGNKAALIGLLTHSGTVSAASSWDGLVERQVVRPALFNSYEQFFSQLKIPNFLLILKDKPDIKKLIPSHLLERAIGVIYLPQTERASHYFYAALGEQFDVVVYLDKTTAITPLETTAIWHKGEVFETFPSGF